MDLILWRHAQAHPAAEGQSDLARALTPLGEQQAKAMAGWLSARLPRAALWSSPARRTQQTAAAWAWPVHTEPLLSPEAAPTDVLAWIERTMADDPLVIVGHQPTLGQVAASLLCGHRQDWAVKKGSAWWLRRRQRTETQWVIQAVTLPEHC